MFSGLDLKTGLKSPEDFEMTKGTNVLPRVTQGCRVRQEHFLHGEKWQEVPLTLLKFAMYPISLSRTRGGGSAKRHGKKQGWPNEVSWRKKHNMMVPKNRSESSGPFKCYKSWKTEERASMGDKKDIPI